MIIIIIIIASSSSWFDEKTAGEMSFWIVFAGLSVVVLPASLQTLALWWFTRATEGKIIMFRRRWRADRQAAKKSKCTMWDIIIWFLFRRSLLLISSVLCCWWRVSHLLHKASEECLSLSLSPSQGLWNHIYTTRDMAGDKEKAITMENREKIPPFDIPSGEEWQTEVRTTNMCTMYSALGSSHFLHETVTEISGFGHPSSSLVLRRKDYGNGKWGPSEW